MSDAEDRTLDSPPVTGLEDIFVLPDYISEDDRILRWYNSMASQLQQEAKGIPMQTAQFTLMERICYFYANMRYQEFNNPNMSPRERRENNAAWQSMLDMFNRLLEKHNDKVVNEALLKSHEIVLASIEMVTDPVEKASIRRFLQEQFAAAGL